MRVANKPAATIIMRLNVIRREETLGPVAVLAVGHPSQIRDAVQFADYLADLIHLFLYMEGRG